MEASDKCTFIFKKSSKRSKSFRKVGNKSSDEGSSDDDTHAVTKSKKQKANPLIQSTSSFRGAKKRQDGNDSNDSDSSENELVVSYKSTGVSHREGPTDMGATATLEIDTEVDRDARTIAEKALKMNKESKDGDDEDKVYKGMNYYKKYILPKDTAAGSAHSSEVARGPVRAPSNLRSTVRWDYKPDICKDYKETGYCGFGDSCIFMHDRSDYKTGWQIELEYAAGKHNQEDKSDASKGKVPETEQIPFKCLICRQSFKDPVVTKCKHYFCSSCALNHHKKSTRCHVCQAQTQGIFNPAKKIIERLNLRKEEREECHEHDHDLEGRGECGDGQEDQKE